MFLENKLNSSLEQRDTIINKQSKGASNYDKNIPLNKLNANNGSSFSQSLNKVSGNEESELVGDLISLQNMLSTNNVQNNFDMNSELNSEAIDKLFNNYYETFNSQ